MRLKIYYTTLIISFLLLTNCSKILEINPKQSIDSSIALQSEEGIEGALISAYSRLQNYKQYGRDLLALAEALSDNTIHTENSSHLINEAANNRGSHLDVWQTGYYAINEINLLIEAIQEQSFNPDWEASILGQAYFLRALNYHNLVKSYAYDPTAIIEQRNYGGVPLMLKGVDDLSKIGSLERAPISAVYAQIYEDLKSASEYLLENTSIQAPHRATLSAVDALYSRVALYNGDWELALEKANQALEQTRAKLSSRETFFSDWMQPVHPESIFEVKFNENENVGSDRSLRATYTSRGFYDSESFVIQGVIAVSPALYDLFEDGDIRKSLIKPGAGNNARFFEMYKFISKNGVLNLDNVPVLRVTELILNRAEAAFHLGIENQALADINFIRKRAGLSEVDLSGNLLFEEILKQRRLELAFEGHRWFDLKRYGKTVLKETHELTFDDYRILAPIPEREAKADNRLKQNYGY